MNGDAFANEPPEVELESRTVASTREAGNPLVHLMGQHTLCGDWGREVLFEHIELRTYVLPPQ